MAIAYNIVRKMPDQSKVVVDITLDGAYDGVGYLLSHVGLGLASAPDMVDLDVQTGQGFTPVWNKATGKLVMYKSAGAAGAHAQCAAGDLSNAVIVRAECIGVPLI